MHHHVEQALARVVDTMRENLGEPLTLDDLAEVAMFSKFHLSRMFLKATGVSPGRFLSALRLQRAKELLLTTDWNVVDIGVSVGYASVGTFSTRFGRSVGLSPTEYRRRNGFAPCGNTLRQSVPNPGDRVIEGWLGVPEDAEPRPVFVGLFAGRVPEGRPLDGVVVPAPGRYSLVTEHAGDAHLLAFSVTAGSRPDAAHLLAEDPSRWVGNTQLASLKRERDADLDLSPMTRLDPPVLMAMPTIGPVPRSDHRMPAGV